MDKRPLIEVKPALVPDVPVQYTNSTYVVSDVPMRYTTSAYVVPQSQNNSKFRFTYKQPTNY